MESPEQKAILKIEQELKELKKSIEIKKERENKVVYIIIDKNHKAICGAYHTHEQAIKKIDELHREDIKIEMMTLKQKILNNVDREQNCIFLKSLECFIEYNKEPIRCYQIGNTNKSNYECINKSNYECYEIEYDKFYRYDLHFNTKY